MNNHCDSCNTTKDLKIVERINGIVSKEIFTLCKSCIKDLEKQRKWKFRYFTQYETLKYKGIVK